jgi:uncharacterized protein (DUF58 family)
MHENYGITAATDELVRLRRRAGPDGIAPHRRVGTVEAGNARSAFRGRGMEFDQVVKYEFGDDVRTIDWRVGTHRPV